MSILTIRCNRYSGNYPSLLATHLTRSKKHNNWSVCYSCGFDVEIGHTSATCHMDWRKPTHDITFMRDNAQQKLAQGCNACTRGMHKMMLPGNAWWLGAENVDVVANKFSNLVAAHINSLDPTFTCFSPIVNTGFAPQIDDNDVRIVMSNRKRTMDIPIDPPAWMLLGHATPDFQKYYPLHHRTQLPILAPHWFS